MIICDLHLPNEFTTTSLAARMAPLLKIGDCILLEGDIGAGKTTFARSLIRARLGRQEDVPSPTFTLVQTYNDPAGDIWHCDLYRLTHPDEAEELGLIDAFNTAICLVEWPDRLGSDQPKNGSRLSFKAGQNTHHVKATIPRHLYPAFLNA